MELDIISKVHSLRDTLEKYSDTYFNSAKLAKTSSSLRLESQKKRHMFNLEYGLKDLMLIGALTQSSVLMTGGTDLGKTTLARLVMNSLFGKEEEGWHRIDVDIDFGKETLTDIDFGVMTDGKSTDEKKLYKASHYLSFPGLITDEINRSHSKLVTKLMHVFDKDISLPDGQRVKIGHPIDDGKKYQFQIAAINEGEDYTGTFDIDKALRRRTVIEIPMDIFGPTSTDKLNMKQSPRIEFRNKESHIDDLAVVYENVDRIPMHPNASLFLAYLESFDYCEHSSTGSKASVGSKGGNIYHICTKPVHGADTICQFIKSFENELCPYIRAISPGVSKNLASAAKGHALLRAVKFGELLHNYCVKKQDCENIDSKERFEDSLRTYVGERASGETLAAKAFKKYVSELSVEVEDIQSMFPFIAYSKIGLSISWVAKFYEGNRFQAVKEFARQAREKFEEGAAKLDIADMGNIIGSGLSKRGQYDSVREYCHRQNPWLWCALEPFFAKAQDPSVRMEDAGYLYARR